VRSHHGLPRSTDRNVAADHDEAAALARHRRPYPEHALHLPARQGQETRSAALRAAANLRSSSVSRPLGRAVKSRSWTGEPMAVAPVLAAYSRGRHPPRSCGLRPHCCRRVDQAQRWQQRALFGDAASRAEAPVHRFEWVGGHASYPSATQSCDHDLGLARVGGQPRAQPREHRPLSRGAVIRCPHTSTPTLSMGPFVIHDESTWPWRSTRPWSVASRGRDHARRSRRRRGSDRHRPRCCRQARSWPCHRHLVDPGIEVAVPPLLTPVIAGPDPSWFPEKSTRWPRRCPNCSSRCSATCRLSSGRTQHP